jgi:hypothetical protein
MDTIAGVFKSRAQAERAAQELPSLDMPNERVALLTPDAAGQDKVDRRGFVTDGEQRGMGAAVGGTVGGAIGAGTGFTGAVLAATIPGIGPIFAIGMLGAAALGLVGALVGEAAGGAYEQSLAKGLPTDEWFVYQDALRQGRSIVLAQTEDAEQAGAVRQSLVAAGAESIDAAREQWWLGLRGAEEDHYLKTGKDFTQVEEFYRQGFEAALRVPRTQRNDNQFESFLSAELAKQKTKTAAAQESFRMGFERGWDYYEHLRVHKAA